MRVLVYARVSTDDKGQDAQVQVDKCIQYAELHGHTVIDTITDEVSGTVPFHERPGGRAAMKLLRSGRVAGVLVFSVDRYSRESPVKVLQELTGFQDMGVKFISVTEPVFNMDSDLAGPVQYLLTWFSSYFLKQHREKVIAGIERAKRQGKHVGRPPRRRIDEPTAKYFLGLGPDKEGRIIDRALSLREAARRLGVPPSTLCEWRKSIAPRAE